MVFHGFAVEKPTIHRDLSTLSTEFSTILGKTAVGTRFTNCSIYLSPKGKFASKNTSFMVRIIFFHMNKYPFTAHTEKRIPRREKPCMLKGINHQMIELSAADNPYFERAFFVLRPDCTDREIGHMQEEARRMLQAAGGYTALDRNRRRAQWIRLLWGVTGAIIGVLISFVFATL